MSGIEERLARLQHELDSAPLPLPLGSGNVRRIKRRRFVSATSLAAAISLVVVGGFSVAATLRRPEPARIAAGPQEVRDLGRPDATLLSSVGVGATTAFPVHVDEGAVCFEAELESSGTFRSLAIVPGDTVSEQETLRLFPAPERFRDPDGKNCTGGIDERTLQGLVASPTDFAMQYDTGTETGVSYLHAEESGTEDVTLAEGSQIGEAWRYSATSTRLGNCFIFTISGVASKTCEAQIAPLEGSDLLMIGSHDAGVLEEIQGRASARVARVVLVDRNGEQLADSSRPAGEDDGTPTLHLLELPENVKMAGRLWLAVAGKGALSPYADLYLVAYDLEGNEVQRLSLDESEGPAKAPSTEGPVPGAMRSHFPVTLWHCGVEPIKWQGIRWYVPDPPFDATNRPEDWLGSGWITRTGPASVTWQDDGSKAKIYFERLEGKWKPPPCA